MLRDNTFRALLLAYTGMMFLGLSDNIRGPLFPEILEAFSVSNTLGAFFFGLASTAGFIGGLLNDSLDRRFGTLPTLRAAVVLMLLSQILVAVAPNFGFLLLGSLVFGLSLGIVGVSTNVLVMRAPGRLNHKKALSGLHSLYAGASLLAPLIVGILASVALNFAIWRMGFVLTALFGLIILILSYSYSPTELKALQGHTESSTSSEKLAQVYVAILVASYVLVEILISSRLSLYMRLEYKASLVESAWYSAGFYVCLLSGRLLFTVWSPQLRLKSQLIMSLLLSVACLFVGIRFHPLALSLAGLCMGPLYPMLMVAITQLFPKSVNQALGWAIGTGSLFVVLMHFIVGYVSDQYSLKTALYLAPSFSLLSLGMLVCYEKIFRRLQYQF